MSDYDTGASGADISEISGYELSRDMARWLVLLVKRRPEMMHGRDIKTLASRVQ